MEGSEASRNRDETVDNIQIENWSQQSEANESERFSTIVNLEGEVDNDVDSPSMSMSIHVPPTGAAADSFSSTNLLDPNAPFLVLDGETTSSGLAPMREEPTLKEKLVERERQSRVETEMARLKRQFAISNVNGDGGAVGDLELDDYLDSTSGAQDGMASRENGSVAATAGEGSIVAAQIIDPYEGKGETFTYPMERFLQEQGTAIKEEEPVLQLVREKTRDVLNQGVVMERFLKEPVVVEPQEREQHQHTSDVEGQNGDRSVSFDIHSALSNSVRGGGGPPTSVGGAAPEVTASGSMPSFSDSRDEYLNTSMEVGTSIAGNTSIANVSVDCIASENPQIADLGEVSDADDAYASELEREQVLRSHSMMEEDHPLLPEPESPSVDRSTSSDQPRVLRLTEAEIQEMAAIEEASRSNGPPSDRDDLSESSFVGELISDFGGPAVDPAGTSLSQGTPTTFMESASMASGINSAPQMSENADDHHSIEAMGASSHTGSLSVTANPPSDIDAHEIIPPSPIPDEIHPVSNISGGLNQHNVQSIEEGATRTGIASAPRMQNEDDEALDLQESAARNSGIVNRRIRPGMFNLKELRNLHGGAPVRPKDPTTPIRRALSAPANMNFELDGFDYDKNATMSPPSGLSGSIRELPANDMWSPGSMMSLSPVKPSHTSDLPRLRNYGTAKGGAESNKHDGTDDDDLSGIAFCENEKQLLLPAMPPEIINSPGSLAFSMGTLDRVFSEIRSKNTAKNHAYQQEAQEYLGNSILKRAFPERFFALTVTLLIEIPVLVMVSGGSDRLCRLTGRSKYQLLMGFLPLSSAISGNVGLQASTLTTRAVSHGHVTPDKLMGWLKREVGAALYLGLAMGGLVGFIAFSLSNFHFVFGLTVMIAQFVSILTAGLTGTLAPLLFSFIFKRDAGKWVGPLETAIQDIVGSFAMVVLSYKILELFGPMDVEPNDMCGAPGFA